MSEIFPRLDPKLSIATGIEAPTAVRAVEAIKQDIVMKLSQVGLGNQVNAEVIAKLEDGSFIAKVAGMPMRLDLPLGTRIGDQLALRLTRLTPRVGFLLETFNQATVATQVGSQSVGIRPPTLLGAHAQHAAHANMDFTEAALPTIRSKNEILTAASLMETPARLLETPTRLLDTPARLMESMKQEVHARLSQLGLNKVVNAEVLSKSSDGIFIAKVMGLPMRLDLPAETQVGDKLALRLASLSPQVSFKLETPNPNLMTSTEGEQANVTQRPVMLLAPSLDAADLATELALFSAASAKSASSISNQNAKQIAGYTQTLPDPPSSIGAQRPQSTQTELSPAGQLISQLLSETDSGDNNNLRLPENRPLIANRTIGQLAENLPAMIENQLKNSIAHSGLFYESHVIDFLQGNKSFVDLSQEPQAKIAPAQVTTNQATANKNATIETDNDVLPVLHETGTNESNVISLNETTQQHEMTDIVRQQLAMLDNNKLSLTGMLAPHMPFTWEVIDGPNDESTNQQRENNDAGEGRYHSFLKVELPRLGIVTIDIDLHSNGVQLALKSQSDISVQELRSHLHDLTQALALSGTNLHSFKASRDEQIY